MSAPLRDDEFMCEEETHSKGWTDWIAPEEGYEMACCDCGLVHEIQFSLGALNRLVFRARRRQRRTNQLRKRMKDEN